MEETTLKEVEATVVTIVPTTGHTMVMEAILMVETAVDAQAQKLDVVEVDHTTVAGHLVVEMEGDVAVVAQETAEDKVRMVVEVVAHVGRDSRVIKL